MRFHGKSASNLPINIIEFFPDGSDERQFCSPGYDWPISLVMKKMYGTDHYFFSKTKQHANSWIISSLTSNNKLFNAYWIEGNEALDCFTSFLVWHLKMEFESNVTDTRNLLQIRLFDFFVVFELGNKYYQAMTIQYSNLKNHKQFHFFQVLLMRNNECMAKTRLL